MHPDDVWVVFNNASSRILHVYSDEFLAERKAGWYWENKDAPLTGSAPNIDKVEYMTLSKAIQQIKDDMLYYERN